MNEHRIKRVIVLDKNSLVGYLSERDMLRVEPGLLDVLIEKLKILQPSFKLRYERV
jgi:CBS domain-containing protein